MDIAGIGTDIVECLRIGRMIEDHGEDFLLRIYTPGEIQACQASKKVREHFAACWAAKEAVLKALGIRWNRTLDWTDIEVNSPAGKSSEVRLTGAVRDLAEQQGVTRVLLSMAHCRAYATGYALALRG
jgi:holo-[acyl-carrier protein] synthase